MRLGGPENNRASHLNKNSQVNTATANVSVLSKILLWVRWNLGMVSTTNDAVDTTIVVMMIVVAAMACRRREGREGVKCRASWVRTRTPPTHPPPHSVCEESINVTTLSVGPLTSRARSCVHTGCFQVHVIGVGERGGMGCGLEG